MKALVTLTLFVFLCIPIFADDPPLCFPECHPDYDEWVTVGMPDSWCYPRQCRGDASGSYQYNHLWVSSEDLLDYVYPNWKVKEPPFGPGVGPSGLAADFDHRAAGSPYTGYYRVNPRDVNILAHYFNKLEEDVPAGCQNCPFVPSLQGPLLEFRINTGSGFYDADTVDLYVGQVMDIGIINNVVVLGERNWYDAYVIMTDGLENGSWTGVNSVSPGNPDVPGWTYYGTSPIPNQDAWFADITETDLNFADPYEGINAYVEYVHDDFGPSTITLFNEFYEPMDTLVINARDICLFAPSPGETLYAGDTYTIQWSANPAIVEIKIEFSDNGGADWTVVESNTANDGSHDWTVPFVESTGCLMRISDAADFGTNDGSGMFSITIPDTLTATWPNGGENLVSGNAYEITWDSTGSISDVAIDYSLDLGNNWTSITTSTVNDGNYIWDPIPAAFSEDCLIYITDTASSVDDVSDGTFTIFECLIAPILGDINNDCYVNLIDVALLAQNWLLCGNPFDPLCDENADADGDGHYGIAYGGDDCDDNDPNTYPGAPELCDGKDNDCDSIIDNKDIDGDGYIDVSCGGADCNDLNADVNPDAPEICNGIDDDCDGLADNIDADEDGFYDAACGGDDCDDSDDTEFPGQVWYPDCDGDGYFSGTPVIACDEAEANANSPCLDGNAPDGGWSHTPGGDCDDEDPTEFPGQMWYPDCDGDGFFSSIAIIACDAAEANANSPCGDGLAPDGGWSHTPGNDCDDDDPTEFPGQSWFPDCDGDGHFSNLGIIACDEAEANAYSPCGDGQAPDGGWSYTPGNDCDDEDAEEFPGQTWYPDCDGDGHYSYIGIIACNEAEANANSPCLDGQAPDGGWSHVPGDDCDDEDAAEFPGQMWYPDCDGDGFFSDIPIIACHEAEANANSPCLDGQAPDGGWSHVPGDDCDDEDPAVNPGAVEICDNLIDDDCDGDVDGDDSDCVPEPHCQADFNYDGVVSGIDVIMITECVQGTGPCLPEMDLNGDTIISAIDVTIVVSIVNCGGTIECCADYLVP